MGCSAALIHPEMVLFRLDHQRTTERISHPRVGLFGTQSRAQIHSLRAAQTRIKLARRGDAEPVAALAEITSVRGDQAKATARFHDIPLARWTACVRACGGQRPALLKSLADRV